MRYVLIAVLAVWSGAAVAQSAGETPEMNLEPKGTKLDPRITLDSGATLSLGALGLGEGLPVEPDRQAPLHPTEEPKPAGGFILTIPIN